MRILVAIGGNALLERGEAPDAAIEQHHVIAAVEAVATVARENQLVVTYGNGPQIGLLALESARDSELAEPYPLDVLGAQTQGMIGYWLLQGFQNVIRDRAIVSLITQTQVSAGDPAFADPTKFIGSVYSEAGARRLADERGWTVKADGGGWRRVVASPAPHRVVESRVIRQLLDVNALVICAGGGGAPVVRNRRGDLVGVDAVVDKDTTAGMLAEALEVDILLILTDVPAVMTEYGTPQARPISRGSPADLRAMTFPAGSMGPKVEAACRFVELTGGTAAIGALADVEPILAGARGTIITPDGTYQGITDGPRPPAGEGSDST